MNTNHSFWATIPIRPIASLAELREMVLARSEKRMPKWKFRLAEDLIMQVQPKLTTALLKFECVAVEDTQPVEAMFAKRSSKPGDYLRLAFTLSARIADDWTFKATGNYFSSDRERMFRLRERLLGVFLDQQFDRLTPNNMLGHHCMCCGKGLTDPASMARFIGPECYGSSSVAVPWLRHLSAEAAK